MPLFYFDVREGPLFIQDEDGLAFPDLERAEQEAIHAVVSIGKDRIPRSDTRDVTVEVRDADGKRVLTVTVALIVQRVDLSQDAEG
ncbi:hypothetical protein ASG40_02730 [Methylobacterium sp. Leaf399]|uniref:DUF6894 family protein n=1 Tax=unclassified Methylobacterium TaxID=2615210 RepID=UPI0006FB3CC4|nr:MULTISPECIES: hypothetical protein [unclassified Methylobacterium]KQP61603.1 hypothetical protein ASF39_02720 [Methylobacterium sp. Leaf108]KQT19754.1 hypothetical protein ASG40_02730 [Methylobacterium sp. Leaf399]KQT80804.1 hypothetical protein ASG59_05155 [Methylobacterium sp. Leaf466]